MERRHGYTLFLVFLICSALLAGWLMWAYVSAIILALLIASLFFPLYQRLRKALKGRSGIASLGICAFVLLVLVIPTAWFVGTLSNEAYDFYKRTGSAVSVRGIQETLQGDSLWVVRVRKWSGMLGLDINPESVEKLASTLGKRIGLFLYRQLSAAASSLLDFLVQFFLMMLTLFYLFRDGTRLKEYLFQHLPVPQAQLEKVALKFQGMGRAIFLGNGISGILQGFLGGLGFFLFDLDSPFLWGSVMAVMAFMPIVGSSVVFIPAFVILLTQGQAPQAFGFLGYNLLYTSLIEYLLKPRLIGKGMRMNSFLVFIGIIGGLKLFGILGIIYGPLVMTVFLTLAEIYRLEYREQSL